MTAAPATSRPIGTRLQWIADRLKGVHFTSNGFDAQCPAHEDRQASLSVAEGEDGRILLRCHVGCTAEAVAEKMGLSLADLMPPANRSEPSGTTHGARSRRLIHIRTRR